MSKEKTPYLIENKERDTFTFYVKGTKPYLDLEKKVNQLTNNWNELEEYLIHEIEEWKDEEDNWIKAQVYEDKAILNKMKEIKERKNVR